jgi:Carboxypeptidase regulatory-like domain
MNSTSMFIKFFESSMRQGVLDPACRQDRRQFVLQLPHFPLSRLSFRTAMTVVLRIVLIVACASRGYAQQGTGSITGRIVDTSGAAVAAASVNITNQVTLTGIVLKSDETGAYASPPLASGPYTIEIEKASFRSASQKNFQLNDDQRAELNFTLEPGSVEEQVVVQANAPALNTFNASLGSLIDNTTAESLPLHGSNALSLLQLDPGVVSGFGPVNDGFNDRGLGVSNIRIGGGLVGSNANLLDGANNLQTTRGEILINSTVTGIQETRLQYGVIPAQYGLTSGGVISMTTKAGTNSLHGQVYDFFENGALNANSHSVIPGTKPALRYNQYGASLGGPLRRNRIFLFGNYEAFGLTQVTPLIITVPTLAERKGDFSKQAPIYDPTTGTAASGTRVAYPGNVIPSSEFDPAALAFQANFVPLPNIGGASTLVNNYASNAPLIASQRVSIGRVDLQATSRTSLFARYAYYEYITNNEGSYGSLPLIASTRNDDLRNQDVTVGVTQVLSGTLLNNIRLAVGRSYFPFVAGSSNQNWPQQLGLANIPPNTLPAITINNYGITVASNQGLRTSLDPEINDTLTILRGLQSFHIGAGLIFNEAYNNSNTAPSGSFSFNTAVTGQTGAASVGTGDAYASFLIGKPSSESATASAPSVVHSISVNGYLQDDWRALPNLTLNFGIRYDYQAIPWEKSNGFSTLRLGQVNPMNGLMGTEVYAGAENGGPRNFAAENYHDIGPRVGFAYLISQSHHTVLRGGYALYYASSANIVYSNATDGFGTNTTTYAAQTTDGYISQFQSGFPYAPLGLPGAGGGASALLGQSPTVQPQSAPTSASQQFALALDHEFSGNTIVDISLLQNHGTHFPMTALNLNQLNPEYYSLGLTALQAITSNPYVNDNIPGTLGGKTMQVLQKLKPYPYFQNVYEYYPHVGSFLGRVGQISIRRPISASLQLQLGYAYSKLLSDPLITSLTAGTAISAQLQNNYDVHSEYGIDNSDVTNRLSGNLTYVLPFGKGQTYLTHVPSVVDRIVSGWNLAGTVIAESGRPLAITGTNGNTATRPNFVPGVSLKVAHPSASEWFNTAAFQVAPAYTFGNVPRTLSQVRGPGALNINLNLIKQVKFERYTGEFQISAFNVINKTNLGTPNTSYVAPSSTSTSTTASAFGTITTALQPRTLQATVRIRF